MQEFKLTGTDDSQKIFELSVKQFCTDAILCMQIESTWPNKRQRLLMTYMQMTAIQLVQNQKQCPMIQDLSNIPMLQL